MQVVSNINQPIIKQEHIRPILKDLYNAIKPYLTWSMLISFGIAWFITNGWCYLLIIIGKGWVRAIALAYAGFLYLPFTIEKPITIWIATRIQKLLFIRRKKKND
jgi:hypothetical protein